MQFIYQKELPTDKSLKAGHSYNDMSQSVTKAVKNSGSYGRRTRQQSRSKQVSNFQAMEDVSGEAFKMNKAVTLQNQVGNEGSYNTADDEHMAGTLQPNTFQ